MKRMGKMTSKNKYANVACAHIHMISRWKETKNPSMNEKKRKREREEKKRTEHKWENTRYGRKIGTSKHLFPRFYSSMSQFYGTSKAIHLHTYIFIYLRQTGSHTHIRTDNKYIRTPFLVHLVSNQTLDEGLVTIETFVKVLHPKNIPNIVVLSILFHGLLWIVFISRRCVVVPHIHTHIMRLLSLVSSSFHIFFLTSNSHSKWFSRVYV